MPRAENRPDAPGHARIVRSPWPRSIRSTAPGFRPRNWRRCARSRKNARASERTARWAGARRARLRAEARALPREIPERGRRARPVAPGMADMAVPRLMGDLSDAADTLATRRAARATPIGTSEAGTPRVPPTIAPIVTVVPSVPVTSVTTAPRGPIVTRVPRELRHVLSGVRFVRIAPASRARAKVRPVPRPFRTNRRSRASCRS
jgi:hypothetical protein